MSTLSERLVRALGHAQITQAHLAREVGVSAPSVHNWFSGKAKFLRGANLLAAAKVLGVSESWLATGNGTMLPTGSIADGKPAIGEMEPSPGYVRFNVLEADTGANYDTPEVMRTIEVAEWEVRRKLGFLPPPGRIQIITGRGPSMRPKLEDGDIVWIDTSFDHFDGDDYYLITLGGETQIKMLQKRGDGLYVVSVNTDFPPYRPEPGKVSILGKALVHAGFRKF
ncbi:helix-turn-helix domain-containing protein [Stenotrophomonas sp. GD03930]|nr:MULTISPECIES: S24 family peptidase [Stenotrophomonas]MBS4799218.1 helix-turn-helix transcriptional regulator [Stenotrophomonas maltophilia]MDG9987713.1 helix-turn-helix domain-containing protein [Stenotrophomonas sp. GD04024]MDH1234314.1 helix-turn-helix domain-containing protein [Stenotrophomonas sp. GD03930]HEL4298427.1 helix-turn-helix transcriptional regulator [Stenotrophomonas maltophilia]